MGHFHRGLLSVRELGAFEVFDGDLAHAFVEQDLEAFGQCGLVDFGRKVSAFVRPIGVDLDGLLGLGDDDVEYSHVGFLVGYSMSR